MLRILTAAAMAAFFVTQANAFEGCMTVPDATAYLKDNGQAIVAQSPSGQNVLIKRDDNTFYDVIVILSPTAPMVCFNREFGAQDPRKPKGKAV